LRRPDPLIGERRRHPDIGDHDVRGVPVDQPDQLVEGRAHPHNLKSVLGFEQGLDPGPQQEAVLGDHHSQPCHPSRVSGRRRGRKGGHDPLGDLGQRVGLLVRLLAEGDLDRSRSRI
jgi:hypothetical protein